MPTEIELCTTLGVGRNTVREALKVLQALGVVEIRHGFGTFVAATSYISLSASLTFRGRLSLRHGGHEALELVDIRQALESGLIGLAIDAMTGADLDALEDRVLTVEDRAAKGQSLRDVDEDFHRLLYASLSNNLLANLLDVFWAAYSQIYQEAGFTQQDLTATARNHRLILEAIKARNKALASERLSVHFSGIRRYLTGLATSHRSPFSDALQARSR